MPDLSQYIELLSWALPPVIGALIGYITNDIAIKMLFRPLRAYRLGPFRVPFTPGIIPRQRAKLAESIGVMVSRELITEDAIRRQIGTPAFRTTLDTRIRELTSTVIYTPLKELPERFNRRRVSEERSISIPAGEAPADTELVQDVLSAFFRSEAFFNGLDRSLGIALRTFMQLELRALAGGDGSKLFTFLSGNVHLGGLREPVGRIAEELTVEAIQNRTGLDRFLTPQSIDGIIAALNRLYPALARELLTFLRTPHIHDTLERRGRTVLRRLISRMSSLQRLFLVAGQYDRNLEKQMEEIVDDVLTQLEQAIADETTRTKILDTLKSWLQRLSTHSIADIADVWGESLPDDIRKGVDSLFNLLESQQLRSWGHDLVLRTIDKYGDRRLGDVLASATGSGEEEVCGVIAVWIVQLIRKAETGSRTTLNFFKQLFAALADEGRRSIADILKLEDQHKTRIDTALHRLVLGVIDAQVPEILDSVDVNTLVVDKINSLDIEKVEELILIVIRTHLRWIVFFGAVLGFAIGSIQVVLTRLL